MSCLTPRGDSYLTTCSGREGRWQQQVFQRPVVMSAGAPHLKPILLVPIRVRQATDGGSRPGIPNPIPPGLYESVHGAGTPARTGPVPPLAYFCIRTLVNYADQVHSVGSHRIRCQPEVLRALSPSAFGDINVAARCLCKLDPRLWSIIAQVYSDLPRGLQNYHIPLGDIHLPLLQAIPSTPSFALITVLSLARCVKDETSHALKSLHGLCALDLSQTPISHLGIRHFAPTTTSKPSDPRYGTRGLRILRLCNCPGITDQVIGAVSDFPLLAILGSYHLQPYYRTTHAEIDLRGTSCSQDLSSGVFRRSKKNQRNLFQCSLQDALQRLRDSNTRNTLFSHPDPFVIHVNTEFHPRWPQRPDRQKFTPSSTTSIYERSCSSQDSHIIKAERELREWIRSMLGDASNETRISEITDFVMRRWEYNPERLGLDGRNDSDLGYLWEEDDSIDSWDEDSFTESRAHFCGYEVDGDLAEELWEMVEGAWEEHKTAMRFYGLDSRAPKTMICHCKELRGTAISVAETMPTDRYLMLVRDPPPWDSVYGPDAPPPRKIRLMAKPSLSNSSNLNPDRSSVRARKSTREVLSMITQRKDLPTTTTTPSPAPTPTVSTNPFRKDSGSARGGLKDPHRMHGNSVQDGNSESVPEGSTPKRMKSISQIPVPPRPTPPAKPQSHKSKSGTGFGIVTKRSGKLKQATLLDMLGKRT